jgi:2-hydroxycyclohexanecarboxyl-CoA dehydrogenase
LTIAGRGRTVPPVPTPEQVALVTGAASGIGAAVARGLDAAGARVVVADRDLPGAEAVAARLTHGAAERVDVAEQASVDALRDAVGPVDIVVNAAGWDRVEPFTDNDPQLWEQLVAINYLGVVRVARAFLDPMLERGAGRIVNVASDAGRVGSSGEAVYSGAKGGVIAFTKSLAREAARSRITVNCVCPGPTDTPLFATLPEGIRAALIRAIPFRRLATPEEVAEAVLFFASDRAGFVTGQVLSVSGGLTMAG